MWKIPPVRFRLRIYTKSNYRKKQPPAQNVGVCLSKRMKLHDYKGKRICVAVSGGVDSTALLHYLKQQEKTCGYTLSAVHCEHGIRGEESVADMRFVQETCTLWSVPLFLFTEDCPKKAEREKTSLETAARNFRYACFEKLLSRGDVDYIATAHHVCDEAETVLFRIARGSGLAGASAMHGGREKYIRPFLDWKKEEICSYAKENGVSYREDYTNFQTDVTRNKLRLTVLPLLEQAVPNATENIARFARIAAEDERFLLNMSKKLLSGQLENDEKRITVAFCEEKPLFNRACLFAMKTLGVTHDYTSVHLDGLFALQSSERGAYLTLPKALIAEKQTTGIVFRIGKERENPIEKPMEKPFNENGFDGGMYAVNVFSAPPMADMYVGEVLRIDADAVPDTAVFRFRKEGDELQKFGGGTKSLKKFFNEKKIPVEMRAFLPLIAEKDSNTVYAVCGVEIADNLKITKDTKRILYIALQKK